MDEQTKEIMDFLEQNYIPLEAIYLNEEKKIFLGSKENRVCRFCGKSAPDVTFKKIAHAIPEFTGNKRLFSYYECDDCNGKVSSLMESHMANYMNIWHTFSQVRGKRGVPSFKTSAKKSRVDLLDSGLNIQDHEGDEIIELDEEKKQIKITATRATYTPIAIYKCLTKIALTVMPENELGKFKNAMAWLFEEKHDESKYNLNALILLFSFAPGIHPFDFQTCMLFKRKDNHKDNVPYMLFLLTYSNFAFQIYLPLCSEDKKFFGKQFTIKFIPTPIDLKEGIHTMVRRQINLSSTEAVKGEKESVTMGFGSLKEMEP